MIMTGFIIGGIFGFALGCSLKDLIKTTLNDFVQKNKGENSNELQTLDRNIDKDNSAKNRNAEINSSFNLMSIKYLFDKYGVKLIGESSFSVLLNKIERNTYKETLKLLSSSVSSPEDLINLMSQGKTQDEKINPQSCNEKLFISDSYLNALLKQDGVEASSVQQTNEKVQLLVSFHICKGLQRFQKTMGPSLEQFIADYEAKKDVSILYEEIMKNIKKALSFISQH